MTTTTLPCQFCGIVNKLDLDRHNQGPKCSECGKPFLLDRPVKITEDQFDRSVLKSEAPVLVDFYADWCGPCRAMAPALDEIAGEQAGKIIVAKINTDQAPLISGRYNIRSIPFFAVFKDGQMVKSAVGAVGKKGLMELLQ